MGYCEKKMSSLELDKIKRNNSSRQLIAGKWGRSSPDSQVPKCIIKISTLMPEVTQEIYFNKVRLLNFRRLLNIQMMIRRIDSLPSDVTLRTLLS